MHTCQPLGRSTIRHAHVILSGALKRAVRWRWIASNPIEHGQAPPQPIAQPRPPSAEEAARRSGEGPIGGDLLTARRRQPGRRPEPETGKEWLAPRTTGPAGMNARREEFTTRDLELRRARKLSATR